MQLKKQNWKKLRKEAPCRVCGHEHETKLCVQRNGKRRVLPALET